jgi:molecular chaperone GrpE
MDKRRQNRGPADPDAVDGQGAGLPVEGADAALAAAGVHATTEGAELATSTDSEEQRLRLERALDVERDKHLRLAAEFDNYRKRSSRERQEAGWRAQADLVAGLLEPLDDILRFAHLDPSAVDAGTVVEGVALVERKKLKSLGGHGLEVLNPVDRPFDPAFHEAVATEPALSSEDDHLVARVYQPGYVFRGQLLRPARVVVKQWPG